MNEPASPETPLQMARRHVRQGEAVVARQRNVLDRLRSHHLPIAMAEVLLEEFEHTLRDHKTHLAKLEAEARSAN